MVIKNKKINAMKNKFLLLIAIAFMFFGMNSCQKVADLTPSVSRKGINSFTASFVNDERPENAFASEVDSVNKIITVVFPYNYPKDSDTVLTISDLTKIRVVANLDDNVTISPAILYMDFTKDNYITVTDQAKNKKIYRVVAEIRKSSECAITNFELTSLGLSGIINENSKTIFITSIDPIGSALAKVSVSHGAVMQPDPTKVALNYNDDVEITVTAQNGTTSSVYTVKRTIPPKRDFGMRSGSAKILWVKKLNTDLGISVLDKTTGIAVTKDYVVINTRGQNSIYLDNKTCAIAGTVNLGACVGDLINFYNTCDDNDNILLCNLASSNTPFKIWKIKGVTGTPEAFIEWNCGVAMGYKFSIKGSIDGDAIITAPYNNGDMKFARWQVKNGILQSQTPDIITTAATTAGWWRRCDIVYTDPTNLNSDYFVAGYALPRKFAWMDGTTHTAKAYGPVISSSWILCATDYVVFNKSHYAVHNTVNSFTYDMDDRIYLYDVSTLSGLNANVWNAPKGIYGGKENGGQNKDGGGDVALKVSDDGYFMYLYFMFTNGCVVCVRFDCFDI